MFNFGMVNVKKKNNLPSNRQFIYVITWIGGEYYR
jgi:hypothetical protein